MFHQVFICKSTQGVDDSLMVPEGLTLGLEENNVNPNITQIIPKQENISSEETKMGFIQPEEIKMAIDEARTEKVTVINNQITMKTDTDIKLDLETQNSFNVIPSYDNTKNEAITSVNCVAEKGTSVTEIKSENIDDVEIKTEEEPMDLYSEPGESEDVKVENGEEKFQEGNGNNLDIQPKIQTPEAEPNEILGMLLTEACGIPRIDNNQSKTESQKLFEDTRTKTHDDELRAMYNIEECIVLVNKSDLGLRKVESVQYRYPEKTNNPVLNKEASLRTECADVAMSGESDWADTTILKKDASFSVTNVAQSRILDSQSIQKKSEPCSKSSSEPETNTSKKSNGNKNEGEKKSVRATYLQKNSKPVSTGSSEEKNTEEECTDIEDSIVYSIVGVMPHSANNDVKFRSMKKMKDVNNHCVPEDILAESTQDDYLENTVRPVLNKESDLSSTDEDCPDVDISSESDWEEEYFGKHRSKDKTMSKNEIHFSAKEVVQSNSLECQSIQKNSKPVSTSSSEEKNTEEECTDIEDSIAYSTVSFRNEKSISKNPNGSECAVKNKPMHLSKLNIVRTLVKHNLPLKKVQTTKTATLNSNLHDNITTSELQTNCDGKHQFQTFNFSTVRTLVKHNFPLKKVQTTKKATINSNPHDNITTSELQTNCDGRNQIQTVNFNNSESSDDTNKTNDKKRGFDSLLGSEQKDHSISSAAPNASISKENTDISTDDENSSNSDKALSEDLCLNYCTQCDKKFKTLDMYNYHLKHSVSHGHRWPEKYKCNICDKGFSTRLKKENHENSHTNARPFKCSDCEKCFNSKSSRQSHHKLIHLNIKKAPFLCCFCAYTTANREHLSAHEQTHELPEGAEIPKPFKCKQCEKGYISRWKLRCHLKEHRKKTCDKCSKKFKSDLRLRDHMEAVHNTDKNYVCEQCGHRFRNVKLLKQHRACSSAPLTLFCGICDKGFRRKSNLQQHMITHSDERPICCLECGERFKRPTHLKQHFDAYHGW